jgi:hypothetical protein
MRNSGYFVQRVHTQSVTIEQFALDPKNQIVQLHVIRWKTSSQNNRRFDLPTPNSEEVTTIPPVEWHRLVPYLRKKQFHLLWVSRVFSGSLGDSVQMEMEFETGLYCTVHTEYPCLGQVKQPKRDRR